MKFSWLVSAQALLYLTACATPSLPPQPTPISPALLAPCPPHLQRPLLTWADVAMDYADLLGELADCRSRHRALADAVTAQP